MGGFCGPDSIWQGDSETQEETIPQSFVKIKEIRRYL